MATSPTLPASTKPYGTTTFLDPTGLLWFGTVALEFTSVYSKDAVDSLIAGIGGNLQSVTDEGNTTTNAIQLIGSDNIIYAIDSLALGKQGTGSSFITNTYNGEQTGLIAFAPQNITISQDTNALTIRKVEDSINAGAFFSSRVGGSDAINPTDFPTLGQVNALIPSVPSLQSVSEVGASTDRALLLTGATGFTGATGLNMYVSTGIAAFVNRTGGETKGDIQFNSEEAGEIKINSNYIYESGAAIAAKFNGRVEGTPAALGSEFTTLDQLTTSLGSFVPYIGATSNVNLGSNNITSNSFIKSGGTSSQFLKADGSVDGNTYQNTSQKNQANGYAGLDSGVKIFLSQLPDSILGALIYQGTWNATTNSPTLANPPSSDTKGHYYVTNTAGTQFGITFAVGDWIVSNGTEWQKVDNSDAVTTVFGRLGNVVANESDYSSFYPLLNGTGATGTWGINISGNAATATNSSQLTGRGADFTNNVTTLSSLVGIDNTDGLIKVVQPAQVRSWLGSPSGGETLQSVTDRGSTTTNSIKSLSGDAFLTDFTSSHTALRSSRNNIRDWQIDNIGGAFSLYSQGSGAYEFNLDNSGNVGIGTTTPSAKLDVNGGIAWGTDTYSSGVSKIYNTGVEGTVLVSKTGSGTDFRLINGLGNEVFNVPAGTQNVVFDNNITAKEGFFRPGTNRNIQFRQLGMNLAMLAVNDSDVSIPFGIYTSGLTVNTPLTDFTGSVTVTNAPVNPTDVLRLTDLSGYLPLTGGTLTGALNYEVGNNRAQLTSDYFRIYNVVDQKSIIMRQSTGLSINTSGNIASAGIFKTDNLTGDRVYQGPNASGTLALTSDIPSNYVTTNTDQTGLTGNKTWDGVQTFTNQMIFSQSGNSGFLVNSTLKLTKSSGTYFEGSGNGIALFTNPTGGVALLNADNLTVQRQFQFPNAAGLLNVFNTSTVPSTSSSTGSTGEIRVSGGYMYICIATDSWVRSAVSTF